MNSPARFIDNNDGSITDKTTGLTWTREDSWQSEAKWFTWDEAVEYYRHLNHIRFCGYADWRLPAREEALSLYDPDAVNQDKYDSEIHLDPVFPAGSLPTIWINEELSGNDGTILDFRNGEIRPLYKSKSGRMAIRPVRSGAKIR